MPFEDWAPPPDGWPDRLWDVPYLPSAIPGAGKPESWLEGSNCQRFAYGVLNLLGLGCPPFRSSELWDDTAATCVVDGKPLPLDLVFYNRDCRPYGAHIGVWMAPEEVLHLCAEVGMPVVWTPDEFSKRGRYSTCLGYKRITRPRVEHNGQPEQ